MLSQYTQILGSCFILIAFILLQLHKLKIRDWSYLVLNVIGSAILALNAVYGHQWGFVLLESVWALVSLAGLISTRKKKM